jgi:hypothetical protein
MHIVFWCSFPRYFPTTCGPLLSCRPFVPHQRSCGSKIHPTSHCLWVTSVRTPASFCRAVAVAPIVSAPPPVASKSPPFSQPSPDPTPPRPPPPRRPLASAGDSAAEQNEPWIVAFGQGIARLRRPPRIPSPRSPLLPAPRLCSNLGVLCSSMPSS